MTAQFLAYYKRFKYEINTVWHDDEADCHEERRGLLYKMIYQVISTRLIGCVELYEFITETSTLCDLHLKKERYYSDSDYVVYTTGPWFDERMHSKVCYRYDGKVLFNFSAIHYVTNIDAGVIQEPFFEGQFLHMF